MEEQAFLGVDTRQYLHKRQFRTRPNHLPEGAPSLLRTLEESSPADLNFKHNLLFAKQGAWQQQTRSPHLLLSHGTEVTTHSTCSGCCTYIVAVAFSKSLILIQFTFLLCRVKQYPLIHFSFEIFMCKHVLLQHQSDAVYLASLGGDQERDNNGM